ncbi:TPA: thioredoxin family protein [Stenotrophomonas maltophilia]|jgi:thioredoxin 1|uniref:Thioredoxin family protein n=1 Tax=Stenotrophomonas maltophilia TaxID=40324 RepID=A0AAI9CE08_STEMA|nr:MULTISPECIES: thioredoxin family protein [Stenotrophomonas]EKT4442945.1 thioredoxin family protein [Stenotrophomonas maltophilia]ELC7367310.1 thioredoxin family protein [Stenotrophomonas maltophilia]ELF4106846.1 thioredoxin family protein [Stenotrophomonas maltophilia]MBA0250065.1 thioredoxin [Stenotrophomonas maltophilia]MBA0318759.1 thioredoxin [Stenotrophomonas maltophilia]
MPFMRDYLSAEPDRSDVEAQVGWQLLEFGAPWCGHCQAAQAALQAFVEANDLPHWKIEDGKGRPLGRAFKVKLWPTVVLLHDGEEVARVVRPLDPADLTSLQSALPD